MKTTIPTRPPVKLCDCHEEPMHARLRTVNGRKAWRQECSVKLRERDRLKKLRRYQNNEEYRERERARARRRIAEARYKRGNEHVNPDGTLKVAYDSDPVLLGLGVASGKKSYICSECGMYHLALKDTVIRKRIKPRRP